MKSIIYMKSYVYLISPRLIVVLEPRLEPVACTFPWQRSRRIPLSPPWLIDVSASQLELAASTIPWQHGRRPRLPPPRLIVVLSAASTFPWGCGHHHPRPPPRLVVVTIVVLIPIALPPFPSLCLNEIIA
jgi:hypothetical protein